MGRDGDGSDDESRDRKRKRERRDRKSSKRDHDESDDEEEHYKKAKDRKRDKKRSTSSRHRSSRRKKGSRRKKSRRDYSSSSSDESSSSSSSSSDSDDDARHKKKKRAATKKKVINKRLLEKLSARGETLEEREERRAQRRAARITAKFGYTAEENPFNDPNLHETFQWKKRDEKVEKQKGKTNDNFNSKSRSSKQEHIFEEIEKVRKRREDREKQFEEMERLKAEESRMKELENYDEWAKKEEEFHLQQQRQRSAIRLVEGREKPVDVLAKNLLLFGLSDEEKKNRAAVKYQERYNAMDELETLEAELEEPHEFLKLLKLNELEDLLYDIDAFLRLEREAIVMSGGDNNNNNVEDENSIIQYWNALRIVTTDEVEYLKTGGKDGEHAKAVEDIVKLFGGGQSKGALIKMKDEIVGKLRRANHSNGGAVFDNQGGGILDVKYWETVLQQLDVHLAKMELSDLHSKMLVRQLEKLEKKKDDLASRAAAETEAAVEETNTSQHMTKKDSSGKDDNDATKDAIIPKGIEPGFGDLDAELGLTDEIDLNNNGGGPVSYTWQDKYRPRKPKYFNRVKTGYDWNKYNQTHYDHDNPPPKTVQGYKFNIFYPDLIDKTKTPKYFLERCNDGSTSGDGESDQFCMIRFKGGPPYEDIAFKIINRQWNKSRKRGFRCTFERGILSLYFNFESHWYRR